MNFRMKLGGDKEEKHTGNEHYTEGYNAGYNNALEEMRRRSRGCADTLYSDHYPVEDRKRARSEQEHNVPSDDVHWPLGARQIGFVGEPPHHDSQRTPQHDPHQRESVSMIQDPVSMIMDMLVDVKQGQESIRQGMTSVKKLDPRLDSVLESATQVLENPPSTWAQYQHRKDFMGIARMEGKELLAALEARKPIQDIRKELTHTIAALFQLVSAQ